MAKDDKKLQSFNSFNSGEYSPSLAGRVDLESFGSSARYMSNFISEATGGIKKFYGTYHIAEIDNGGQILMIPFYNSYEPMCFVLTPNFIGVIITNDYFELSFPPLATNDLSKVKWAQSNDKIFLTAPDMPMVSLNFLGPQEGWMKYKFELSDADLTYEPFFPIGWDGNYNGAIETTGINGTIEVRVASSNKGIQIDLPEVLEDSSQFNILGANNYLGYNENIGRIVHLGQTTTSLIRIRNNNKTVLSQGIVSGSPTDSDGVVVSSTAIKDN